MKKARVSRERDLHFMCHHARRLSSSAAGMEPIRNCLCLSVFFVAFCLVSSEALDCTFPDFSHRQNSAETWIRSRRQRQILINWDSKQWSTIHRRLDARSNASAWNFFEKEKHVDEYMRWAAEKTPRRSSLKRFRTLFLERPWWRADGSQVLNSFAAEDLKQGDRILSLHVQDCLSDLKEDSEPTSTDDEAPWEARLATKLLRERAKGATSKWAPYIKLLPSFISIPIFFSDLEIINIQDKSVEDEVNQMRDFAKSTFRSLRSNETGTAKFGDYVWALSVVYSSSCQAHKTRNGNSEAVSHYLVPFFSAHSEDSTAVHAKIEEGRLELVADNTRPGTGFFAGYAPTTLRDLFIFRGVVPTLDRSARLKLFTREKELVDWYLGAHGGVNYNRYLTFKIAEDALDTLGAHIRSSDPSYNHSLMLQEADFSIQDNGEANKYMICVLATLSQAMLAIKRRNELQSFSPIDFMLKNGTTAWEGVLKGIAIESIKPSGFSSADCATTRRSPYGPAFSAARSLLRERIAALLDSFPTTLVEDEILLNAASWEGMNELEEQQLACPSCRWQTEQMSYHDNLAVQFRFAVKSLMSRLHSKLACGASFVSRSPDNKLESFSSKSDNRSLAKFLSWCQGHGLIISDKLEITDISLPVKDGGDGEPGTYRGVVAVTDIHQGETLTTLPMTTGLFNNDSAGIITDVDTWDMAAARLLRERAKGEESIYAPYIAILPKHLPTPIHLEETVIKEVQWLPVMREIVQVRKAIKESFEKLSGERLGWSDFSDYEWAVTMVHSRAFTLPVRGDNNYEQYVLMPFMDMINHHYRYQADWMSQDIWDGKLDIVARRSIKKGDELFASFGPRSNDNLFLYYGFLLEDNPFDSSSIFGSYEEALKWFLDLWSPMCTPPLNDPWEKNSCQQRKWQSHCQQMKTNMEDIEEGSSASNVEWARLMGYWADLGFEFLPYQPGPTLYINGVIDPGLITAFSSLLEVIVNVTAANVNLTTSQLHTPCDGCKAQGKQSANGSFATRKFFTCLQSQPSRPRGLLNGNTCGSELSQMLLSEQQIPKVTLLARVSVALRCSQILSSFATTIEEDMRILSSTGAQDCRRGTSSARGCSVLNLDVQLQLTRRYRLMKKRFLKAPIVQLLS